MGAETSQTLDRGLRVLRLLAEREHGLSVNQLSAELGVNRTVVYRLVATLERHHLARRDPEGHVHVGFAVLHLSHGIRPMLRAEANPVLRSLAERVAATAHLTIADGAESLAIAVVEPSRTDFHVAYRVGARHPLELGAAGRAILLGRDRPGGRPYVATDGELQRGAHGVAAPVLGVPGVEASVGVVALEGLEVDRVGRQVARAATEIARRLTAAPG